ncbi:MULTISPECIES: ABC transporter ATP-binding protein [unclassified Butyrivibrio]|uniref:ABC transporter ATP-binding protein n=1 Tax=unclassified Butyrivibrio TaxID=2639466 RepID=UPI00089EE57C|nr:MULTISPECIES: ABC transporter ATP-binding protein [unclassified Butyrivibrio]MBE5838752.1 ABC transporter ATP-binding protein [Butyrivibrio sp.]MBQ9304399.1 ABC transporter ATP-binding protein [Butyrivibrio sp.]SEG22163.1 ABC-type bacteriocin/lantibiotic exporter, contains an N-terminal double-glycine peptidase domain [Butyrivibrio sp. Su6]
MRKIYKKVMKLLDARQKRQMVGIVIMMLIGGVLESMGIALIAPVMQVVVDPEQIQKSKALSFIYNLFNFTSPTQLAALIMVMLILVFVVKNVFLYFMNVVQLRFVYTNQFATSRRMMINFMQRPYEYYLNADTSVIQRNITSDVNNMYGLILSSLQLISEIIVFICLVAILISQDAEMTITIAALLVVVLLVIKYFIKPVMTKAGQENQDYYSGLYKWIDESVTGIKEIKIANKENYFINGYADCGAGYVNAVQKYNLYNSTPRLLIETIAIAGMVGYMLVVMARGTSLTQLLPQLTVLAAAAARLLPSANRINNYLTSIAYFEPFLMNVSDNLQMEIHDGSISYNSDDYRKKKEVEKLPVLKSINLDKISYKYPGTDKLILDNADMEIPVGKSVGIVGTSGAGKTTIVDVMLGLLKPVSGHIYADGVDVMEHYPQWLKNIGYIPQTIFMIDSTIRKNVAFGYADDEIDDNKVWQALKEASLDEFVRSLPEGLDTKIGERGIRLSGGQRQRIGIARALFEDPEVLVLDEATSALDNETEAAIMDSINRLHGRKTLVIIAHRLQTIEKCDMVYSINDGKAVIK